MRVLVAGAGGQLGQRLVGLLPPGTIALSHAQFDIGDAAAVEATIAEVQPDVVINAAAYTAVDQAEEDEAGAERGNVDGPRHLAESLARHRGRLIHVSTDYVFSGNASKPYETSDPTGPATAYGRTKLAGEQAVLAALPEQAVIVRTAWVIGARGANFLTTMQRLEGERDTVSVVDDQVGSPTLVGDLAAALVELAGRPDITGLLHFVNADQASWFDLAQTIFVAAGADPKRVLPVDTAAFPRPAPRPAWSVLSTRSWTDHGLTAPRPWRDALAAELQ